MGTEQKASSRSGTSSPGAPGSPEAVQVLRRVWRGQQGDGGDPRLAGLAGVGEKSCRRMTDAGVGFDGFGGADEKERAAAWRARLAREGKLNPASGGLRDLLTGTGAGGPAGSGGPAGGGTAPGDGAR